VESAAVKDSFSTSNPILKEREFDAVVDAFDVDEVCEESF
jgi:hypothetical protein